MSSKPKDSTPLYRHTEMNWTKLQKCVHFDDSDIVINWNMAIRKLKKIGQPDVVKNNGRTEIIWRDSTLLEIKGDWSTSYFPYEIRKLFKSIHLSYPGDKQSLDMYEKIKKLLLNGLGTPVLEKENDDEKEVKWERGNCYVYLNLFEMHAYRCSLTIGIN
jgi:hypothetical protein